jgi:hypothetical protein
MRCSIGKKISKQAFEHLKIRTKSSTLFLFQKIEQREREHAALIKELCIFVNEDDRESKLASLTMLVPILYNPSLLWSQTQMLDKLERLSSACFCRIVTFWGGRGELGT